MEGLSRETNGIFVVDKPAGITSYDVVRELKMVMPGTKIGYLGTLDPLATGVLPILLGEGTKLAPFLEEGAKVYEAVLMLGIVTDTQDKDGKTLQSVDVGDYDLSPPRIEDVMQGFRGPISQLPPMHSALKRNGEPLYKLARRGGEVPREPREVEIHALRVTKIDPPFMGLHVECSKGTYVRTLVHDIGAQLGCGAHLTALRRQRNGPFGLEDALTLREVEALLKAGKFTERVIPLSQVVDFLPAVAVSEKDALQIHNGQTIPLKAVHHKFGDEGRKVRVLMNNRGGLVAIGEIQRVKEGLVLRPLRVFHDIIFTKGPPCGRNTVHNMTQNMGGR